MRFIFYLAILTIIGSVILQAQPKIEIVGGNTYDWKDVKAKDSPLKAKVQLKNTGNQVLMIKEVKPGCGCTTAPLDKNEVSPGDVATLSISLNVSSSNGEVYKSISIKSNDPGFPDATLWLRAKVTQPISISPSYFTFVDMKVGFEYESKVVLKNNTLNPVKFSLAEKDPKNLFFNHGDNFTLKPGEETQLSIKIKPDKVGSYRSQIKLKTDFTESPEVNISGYGNVVESPVFNN